MSPRPTNPAPADRTSPGPSRRANRPFTRNDAETVMLPAFKIGPDAAVQHSPDDALAPGAVTGEAPAAGTGAAATPRRGRHGSGAARPPSPAAGGGG